MTQKLKTLQGPLVVTLGIIIVLMTAWPSRADACGYVTLDESWRVRETISDYVIALMQGDAKAIQANWDLNSGHSTTIVTFFGIELVWDEGIAQASRRWSKDKDDRLEFEIDSIDVDQGAAFAKVSLTWHGDKRIEYLTLLRINNEWKLVSKVHVAAEQTLTSASTSPY